MMEHARYLVDQQSLDERNLYKNLRSVFPKVNDYAPSDTGYTEELNELIEFGIETNKQLRLLLKKHRSQLLIIDRSPIDFYHQKLYREEMGRSEFRDHMRKNYWFAYPALLRIALELEFGEKYEQYLGDKAGV